MRINRIAFAILGLSLLAIGCGRKEASNAKPWDNSQPPRTAQNESPNPASTPDTVTTPNAVNPNAVAPNPGAPNAVTPGKAPTRTYPPGSVPGRPRGPVVMGTKHDPKTAPDPRPDFPVKKPNTAGWGPTEMTLTQLARKVDDTMKGMKHGYGRAGVFIATPDMKGSVNTEIRVEGGAKYNIEYVLPTDPTRINRLVGNGAKHGMYELGKWSLQPKGASDDLAVLRAWPTQFPRFIYAGVAQGVDAWSSLVRALAKGADGYHTLIEQRTLTNKDGLPQVYYRVFAEKKGATPTQIEARFDAGTLLPVAIRVYSKDTKGRETKVQWQAAWNFSMPMEAKLFTLPENL